MCTVKEIGFHMTLISIPCVFFMNLFILPWASLLHFFILAYGYSPLIKLYILYACIIESNEFYVARKLLFVHLGIM